MESALVAFEGEYGQGNKLPLPRIFLGFARACEIVDGILCSCWQRSRINRPCLSHSENLDHCSL
jgi:hypothetical protein